MGALISRFRKKSAAEQLENIEEEIKELEACSADTKLRHQKITKQLLIYSSGLCVIFAVLLYFYIPPKLQTKIILITLLLLSPLIYYIVNKIISWYYKRKITSSHSRLKELKKEKKRLIDEIMDKETYKVAKEILEKYAPEALPQKYPARFGPGSPIMAPGAPGQLRTSLPNVLATGANRSQPMVAFSQGNRSNFNPRASNQSRTGLLALPEPGPAQRMQSFIRDKGYVERVFEYLVGDGPNNRYALICSNCSTHNGMALQEEFEYTAFKCYACFTLNPARKQRPTAPKLEGEKPDQDIREPGSASSSVSGEQGNVLIEEVEDDEKVEEDERGYGSRVTVGEVKQLLDKPDADNDEGLYDPSGIRLNERTSSGTFAVKGSSSTNSEIEEETRSGSTFTNLSASTTSNDLNDGVASSDATANRDADSGPEEEVNNHYADD